MKILHISSSDVAGGAARAAYLLHTGLLRLGHDSSLLVQRKRSNEDSVTPFSPAKNLRARVGRSLRNLRIRRELARYDATRPDHWEAFSSDRSPFRGAIANHLAGYDVVNLHWVGHLLDYRAFLRRLPRPVVWTLHDMNPFTGGCHYDWGCGRFTDSCGACPLLGSRTEVDLSRRVWRRKRAAFARLAEGSLHVVAASRWLAAEARRSSLMAQLPIRHVHYGLDLDAFSPRDRSAARLALGLPVKASILLFVAHNVSIRRKGFRVLGQALTALAESGKLPDLFLLSVGRGNPPVPAGIEHLHLGECASERLLSVVYNAADVFVIPSFQDNLPLTALEAVSCGIPVVGSDTGGIPEIVRDGETGKLVPPGDAEALRAGIEELLENAKKRAILSANGRKLVLTEHSLEVQSANYLELYEEILRQWNAHEH